MNFAGRPETAALAEHRKLFDDLTLKQLFSQDSQRFEQLSINADELLLDYSKNLITQETCSKLVALAGASGLTDWIDRLFSGVQVNNTEHRPALHMALRTGRGDVGGIDAAGIQQEVDAQLAKMEQFVQSLHQGKRLGCTGKPIKSVVNIGIGGSDLGLVMAAEALKDFQTDTLKTYYVSSIDGTNLKDTLAQINPETTLFVICSKSFGTIETLTNGNAARAWMKTHLDQPDMEAKHFAAVSVNLKATKAFGITDDNVFKMWDWVGGRYSICSAVGLVLACAIGMDNFRQMLAGCQQMDQHFRSTDLANNMPVILGLLAVWYNNFFHAQSHVVLPYDNRLHRFPAYLQQLQMESNGKRVQRSGAPVDWDTGQVIWGEPGPNAQHSFYQLLHQGTRLIPADFLVPVQGSGFDDQHTLALAACFAQSRALAFGQSQEEVQASLGSDADDLISHRVHPGNRPSTTVVFPSLKPFHLGQLIALYEHKVFVESVIWGINPFDQFGVELGKRLASALEPVVVGKPVDGLELDSSTQGLCDFILKNGN